MFNQVQHVAENEIPASNFAVNAPFTGKIQTISNHPSSLFSRGHLGAGVVIEASGFKLLSPVTGLLEKIAGAGTEYYFKAQNGVKVLVSIDVDEKQLPLIGYKLDVHESSKLTRSDLVASFDFREQNSPVCVTMIILTPERFGALYCGAKQVIAGQDPLIKIVAKKKKT